MNASGDGDAVWNALAAHGLPLGGPERSPFEEGGLGDFPGLVAAALRDLALRSDCPDAARKRECLAAFLLALATSYPSRYEEWFEGSPAVGLLTAGPPTGRMLKLKRIAERRLSEIL